MIHISAIMNAPARRPVLSLLLVAVAAVVSLLLVLRLQMDVSLQGMTSSSDPASVALDRIFNRYSSAEELLILATLPPELPADPYPLLEFAKRLEEDIKLDAEASKQVLQVSYHADPQTREFVEKVIGPAAMFYLTDEQFAEARQRLTREGMAEQFRRNEQLIAAPGPAAGAMSKTIELDPLRLHEFLLDRLVAMRPIQPAAGTSSDAFLSPDARSILIRISGTQPPSQIEFAKQMTATLARVAESVNVDNLQLDLSGAYPIAAHSATKIRSDTILSIVSSVISLALLFGIVYRTPIRLFHLAMAPVAIGVLLGFGAYSLFKTTITPLTAVIGGVLAGIGIDYSLHYLTHYQERRRAGRTAAEAIFDTTDSIGTAMFAAWATSVVGFFAIGFASVRMLQDFALAGALGLAGAFVCTLVLLPAILVVVDRKPATRFRPASRIKLDAVVGWSVRARRFLIPAGVVIMLLPIIGLAFDRSAIELESDLTILHPRPNPPLDAQTTIAKAMGISPGSLLVHLSADSDEKLLSLAHQVQEKLTSQLAKDAGITSTLGIATILPDPRKAQARIAQAGPALAERVLGDFDAAIAGSSFSAEAFAPYRGFLKTLLTQTSAPSIDSLGGYDQLRQSFLPSVAPKPGELRESMMLVFTRDSLDQRADRQRVLEVVRTQLGGMPGVVPTGMAIISHDIEATIHRDLPKLVGLAVLVVGVYLLVHFRSVNDAMLALLPTCFSLACVLGVMELTGQRLNLVNIVAIPLLIGIDVDYGIFLVGIARSRSSHDDLAARLATSCQAILLCALTTLLGFGSIYFTSIPAIQSLGLAVSAGVIGCAIGSIFLLTPILLAGRENEHRGAVTQSSGEMR